MTLQGKTVLVTGGTGFVGGRLVEKLILEHGAKVRVLVRNFNNAARIARFPIQMIGGDITDEAVIQKAARGCDIVFHCAHDAALHKEQQKLKMVQGVQGLCQAVLREGVSRIVHVSTFAVYGPTLDGDLTETSPWQLSDHSYIQAKRAAERFVLDMYRQDGLPVVVVQPTIVYGPFGKPWTLRPINDLKTGLVPLVNGGQGYCNAVYIDDVVEAMTLAAIRSDVLGEVFLISGLEPVTWKTFYHAFEQVLGVQATIDITEEKLVELERKRARGKSVTGRLLRFGRERRVISRLTKVFLIRGSLKILKKYVPEEKQQSIKSYLLPEHSKNHQTGDQSDQSIHVPNETLLALYRSHTWVRIDKAQNLLGYRPGFNFDQGVNLTSQFIRWANLV